MHFLPEEEKKKEKNGESVKTRKISKWREQLTMKSNEIGDYML